MFGDGRHLPSLLDERCIASHHRVPFVRGRVALALWPGDSARMRSASHSGIGAALLVAAALAFEVVLLSIAAVQGDLGVDFEQTLLPAAETVAAGNSPYPAYGYPPLVAFALAPLTLLPYPTVLFTVLLLGCVPLALVFLGVRDPRCHAVALLWAPVFSATQTGNVTLLLLVGIATCWRYRDSTGAAGVAAGLATAAKILCWPLLLWLAASHRTRAAGVAVLMALATTLGLWAFLAFDGLLGYPDSLRSLGDRVAPESYTLKAMLIDSGLATGAAGLIGAAVALGLGVGIVVLGRRGDDRRSFSLAVLLMIAASPIVWLHSFALLLAPVALASPRLRWFWLPPLALILTSGNGNGEPWQTVLVFAVTALTMLGCLLPPQPSRASGSSAQRLPSTS
jgi:hypothetical protein